MIYEIILCVNDVESVFLEVVYVCSANFFFFFFDYHYRNDLSLQPEVYWNKTAMCKELILNFTASYNTELLSQL